MYVDRDGVVEIDVCHLELNSVGEWTVVKQFVSESTMVESNVGAPDATMLSQA